MSVTCAGGATRAPTIQLRREPFEFGLLPASYLLPRIETAAALVPIQKRLLAAASASASRPGQSVVTAEAAAHCMGISAASAGHVLDTLAAVSPREDTAGFSDGGVDGAGSANPVDEVQVQSLLLYLFLQTYTRPHAQSQLRETAGPEFAWPESSDPHPGLTGTGGGADRGSPSKGSPTGKRPRGKMAEAEMLHVAFVLKNWSAIAGLLVNAESRVGTGTFGRGHGGGGGGDVELTARDVDCLEFMFAPLGVMGAEGEVGGRLSFSALTGLFASQAHTVSASAVRDWIVKNCAGQHGQHGQTPSMHSSAKGSAVANGGGGRLVVIEGVHKGTVVRRDGDIPKGASVRVSGCHDAVIYLLAPVEYASIVGCSDCVVVVGAATRALRVEQCERLTCIAATKRLQVRSSHEGTFHLGIVRQPMFIGDNRRNRVAPYNTFYEQLERHLVEAGISPQAAVAWDQPVVIGAPGGMNAHTAVEILPAERFAPFIVPFRGASPPPGAPPVTQANPFVVPPAYVQALDHKVRAVAALRAALRDAALDDSSKHELQATIQAYFKEWLLTSGSMRQVYDLARIERGE